MKLSNPISAVSVLEMYRQGAAAVDQIIHENKSKAAPLETKQLATEGAIGTKIDTYA